MNTTPINTINYLVPAVGNTHAVVLQGTFSAQPYVEDWQAFSNQNSKFLPQGVFIDNSAGTSDLVITLQPLNFVAVVCKAGTRGQYQFLAPNNLTVEITGGGVATVAFVDFPVLPNSGSVYVENTVDTNIVSSITLPVLPPVNVLGVPYSVQQTPAAATCKYLTLSGAAVTANVAPPANSNLRKLVMAITDNATLAAAGICLVTVTLNGTQVFKENVYIPAAPGNSQLQGWHRDIPFDGVAFNTGAAGTLVVTIGTALATGILDLNAYFD